MSNRALWKIPTAISFQMRLPTISTWIEECTSSHAKCTSASSSDLVLPGRLIDVSPIGIDRDLRLIETAYLNLQSILRYFTLSHCWGTDKIPLRATVGTVDDLRRRIPFDKLPRTFQEAVEVTRGLGCRYLWIDALCIIQDNQDDWRREAAKMATIYQGALLTICAATSTSCHGGCGISNTLPPAKHFTFPQNDGSGADVQRVSISKGLGSINQHGEIFRKFPIHQRGWILQERLLSQRILYMTNNQMYWQCRSFCESEDGVLFKHRRDRFTTVSHSEMHVPLESFQQLRNKEELALTWYRWMSEYQSRKLTYQSDGLPALAGIVRLYQSLTKDKPVIGLWEHDLHLHLGWAVFGHGQLTANEHDSQVPSWTWASVRHSARHKVSFDHIPFQGESTTFMHTQFNVQARVTIEEISVQWEAEPFLSAIRRGIITLRGNICEAILQDQIFGLGPIKAHLDSDLLVDKYLHQLARATLVLLWTVSGEDLDSLCYLIVEPTNKAVDEYYRVGVVLVGMHASGVGYPDFRNATDNWDSERIGKENEAVKAASRQATQTNSFRTIHLV
jgi:hypothetical protein